MFGLKETPYPAHELTSFWCDSDNENYFFYVLEFLQIFQKFANLAIHPCSDYF